MASSRSGGAPEDRESGSWANETLPLSVRRELLERELSKLGIRKVGSHGGREGGSPHPQQQQQQQQPQGGSDPQADEHPENERPE